MGKENWAEQLAPVRVKADASSSRLRWDCKESAVLEALRASGYHARTDGAFSCTSSGRRELQNPGSCGNQGALFPLFTGFVIAVFP